MNKNSHKIGMKNTHFNNSTGLSDKNNFSTANDMALLTTHCLKNHTLRMIFKKKFHTCEVKNDKLCQTRYFYDNQDKSSGKIPIVIYFNSDNALGQKRA